MFDVAAQHRLDINSPISICDSHKSKSRSKNHHLHFEEFCLHLHMWSKEKLKVSFYMTYQADRIFLHE